MGTAYEKTSHSPKFQNRSRDTVKFSTFREVGGCFSNGLDRQHVWWPRVLRAKYTASIHIRSREWWHLCVSEEEVLPWRPFRTAMFLWPQHPPEEVRARSGVRPLHHYVPLKVSLSAPCTLMASQGYNSCKLCSFRSYITFKFLIISVHYHNRS